MSDTTESLALPLEPGETCTFNTFIKNVLSVLPMAVVTEDDDGQLLIHSGLEWSTLNGPCGEWVVTIK